MTLCYIWQHIIVLLEIYLKGTSISRIKSWYMLDFDPLLKLVCLKIPIFFIFGNKNRSQSSKFTVCIRCFNVPFDSFSFNSEHFICKIYVNIFSANLSEENWRIFEHSCMKINAFFAQRSVRNWTSGPIFQQKMDAFGIFKLTNVIRGSKSIFIPPLEYPFNEAIQNKLSKTKVVSIS